MKNNHIEIDITGIDIKGQIQARLSPLQSLYQYSTECLFGPSKDPIIDFAYYNYITAIAVISSLKQNLREPLLIYQNDFLIDLITLTQKAYLTTTDEINWQLVKDDSSLKPHSNGYRFIKEFQALPNDKQSNLALAVKILSIQTFFRIPQPTFRTYLASMKDLSFFVKAWLEADRQINRPNASSAAAPGSRAK